MNTIIFVVTWTVSVWVSTPCPGHNIDPYRGANLSYGCLVNHGKYVEEPMRMEFQTEKEALDFVEKAPSDIRPRMEIEKREFSVIKTKVEPSPGEGK